MNAMAANKIDIKGTKENYERIKKEFPDITIIPYSSESELALREAAKNELIHYIPGETDFKIKNPEKLTEKQKKEFIEGKSITVNKSNMDHTHRILTYAKFIQNNSNHITDEARELLKLSLSPLQQLPQCIFYSSQKMLRKLWS